MLGNKIDFKKIKKAYLIGIKGSGVIAVAEILNSMGIEVSGSDTEEKFFTDEILERLGLKYFEKFSPENIPEDTDLIIYSTAYNENNNIEFKTAKERGIPMISYPDILAKLFNQKYGIAVCGTHGKTTTSALLAEILKECSIDPSAVIGGKVTSWNSNSLLGKGEFFVIEADEFQNKLALYEPKMVILTSLDWDHPDTYKNFSEYKKAFIDFVSKLPKTGFLAAWGDGADTLEVAKNAQCEIESYGFNENNDVRIFNYELKNSGSQAVQEFEIWHKDKNLGKFSISLIGKHNALNVAAVVTIARKLNLNIEKVKGALNYFQGITRRFEFRGKANGAILFDDYGHHPEEIKVTLKAIKETYPKRNLIVIFHPHSYSRTEALLEDFAQSFDLADKVIVLDIYGSAREFSGKVNSKRLADLINKYNPNKAEYIPTIQSVTDHLKNNISSQDLVLSLGAGNSWEILEQLKKLA